MKIIFCLFLYVSTAHAQDLTQQEKRLIEENRMLREEIAKMKAAPVAPPQDSTKMMEALQKARQHREETNQILQDLDNEE